jgi:hypothetical protein
MMDIVLRIGLDAQKISLEKRGKKFGFKKIF